MQPRPAKLAGWLLASATFTLTVGIALLISSCRADGANNFPVPVLADRQSSSALRTLQSMGERTARESATRKTLAAGNSFSNKAKHDTTTIIQRRVPSGMAVGSSLVANSICRTGPLTAQAESARSRLVEAPGSVVAISNYGRNYFLDAIESIESNGNPQAIGDKGKARGSFQFWATAWADCSRARSKQGLSVAHYWCATNRAVARSYAMTYLGMLHHQLTRALRRTPTHAELYAAWNMGFTAYRRTGFSLSRCPESTRRAAARINSMLALSQGGAASKGRMHNVASVAVARR